MITFSHPHSLSEFLSPSSAAKITNFSLSLSLSLSLSPSLHFLFCNRVSLKKQDKRLNLLFWVITCVGVSKLFSTTWAVGRRRKSEQNNQKVAAFAYYKVVSGDCPVRYAISDAPD